MAEIPVVNPNAGPAPAVTQPPTAVVPAPSPGIGNLLNDPYRLRLMMGGLGMMFADTRDQQDRYLGGINQALMDRSQWERDAPVRDRRARYLEAQTRQAESEVNSPAKFQELLQQHQSGEIDGKTFAQALMGLPGYETVGASLFSNYIGDAGGFTGPDGTVWKNRKEYEAARQTAMSDVDPLAEELAALKGNFQSLAESAQVPDGVGRGAADQAMIFSFAKMLDPRSVVRTEEGQAIARTDGYFGALQGFLKQVEGKGSLSADGRRGLVEEAYRQMQAKGMPIYERLVAKNQTGSPLFGDLASPGVLGFNDWVTGFEMPTYFGEGNQPGAVPPLLDPNTAGTPPPTLDADGKFPWE